MGTYTKKHFEQAHAIAKFFSLFSKFDLMAFLTFLTEICLNDKIL
jgi:hypothetical protein